MSNVLLIDDDHEIRFGLNRVLGRCGHSVIEAESGEDGLKQLDTHPIDLVFCDIQFPTGMSGQDTLDAIIQSHPDVKVVMMSCAMDYNVREQMEEKGASECVQKPFFKEQCISIINTLIPNGQEAA